jgi:MFS family permease
LQPGMASAVQRPKFEQWKHTLAHPKLGVLVGVFFFATFCFTCFETTLPLLLTGRPFTWFGKEKTVNQGNIGYLFAYCGLLSVCIQGGGIGKMVKRFGETQLISGSLMVVGVSLVMIPLMPGLAGLLAGLGLFAIGSGINRAPTMGLISQFAPVGEQGATLGVAQSVGTLARVVGPPFATGLFAIKAPLPYLICAGIAACTGLFAWQKLHKPSVPPAVN